MLDVLVGDLDFAGMTTVESEKLVLTRLVGIFLEMGVLYFCFIGFKIELE